jgi:hypothetical protein
MAVGTSNEGTSGKTGMGTIQAHMTTAWKMPESDEPTEEPERRETENEAEEECVAVAGGGAVLKVTRWFYCR